MSTLTKEITKISLIISRWTLKKACLRIVVSASDPWLDPDSNGSADPDWIRIQLGQRILTGSDSIVSADPDWIRIQLG